MIDTEHFKRLILKRLAALGHRMEDIDAELGHEMSKDLGEQAIDIEDDEVLERLGIAAHQEVSMLNAALKWIEEGSYGICKHCGEEISQARLEAVPFTPLCQTCARAASA